VTERASLVPLPRPVPSYSDRTATVLREKILSGALRAGERINEVETAAALGISRAPLREALKTLVNEGLVVAIANRGAFVRSFSAPELADLYELRIALELRALTLANERASPADIKSLDVLLDETDDRMAEAAAGAYPGELDFHLGLVALSRSTELLTAAQSVNHRISLARFRSGQQPVRARHAFDQHREIVNKLQVRDLVGASALLERHLGDSLANASAIFTEDTTA
jgi:DNA-binding GntR family transcriptional regulator